MTAKTLMIQGTGSNVGKSIIVTALCRIFRQEGFRVAPFKSQNMALNSFVTLDGGEIGRAQAVQAEAAGIEPTVDMNPILLKPEADAKSQVVILGKPAMTLAARDYYKQKPELLKVVASSLERLRSEFDIVVIEGAGSPAEINLRDSEIVNMRVAKLANSPVLLVGDIDKGGVLASLVGTLELLQPDERELVKGFIINKFRGDPTLFYSAVEFLEKKTGRPVVGIVPFLKHMRIAQEDSVFLEETGPTSKETGLIDIAVIKLPYISNYDDFDPFDLEESVSKRYVSSTDELGRPDLIIIPGTKNTISDLNYLIRTGLAERIRAEATRGTAIIGVCGGFQMLGTTIKDPLGVESREREINGLGLLEIETEFSSTKVTNRISGRIVCSRGLFEGAQGTPISGYEIHMGISKGDEISPAFELRSMNPNGDPLHNDGFVSSDGWICGTYLHGFFHNDEARRRLIANLLLRKGLCAQEQLQPAGKDDEYDRLADAVRSNLDMRQIFEICGLAGG